MNYFSNHKKSPSVSFREAVMNGLAPDGGLYMPGSIPELPEGFLQSRNISMPEIGHTVARNFIGSEIPESVLEMIISKTLNFVIPVFPLEEDTFCMELFHGPTLAFKDVGARFMAGVISHFAKDEGRMITILTATSGDTGSAVANAFYEKEGIRVVILYPKNGVSPLQEKQMTSLGENISAIAIDGTFDDCQRLVKTSFSDEELKRRMNLTSSNSINIARLLPQSFYYLYAYSIQQKHADEIVFSVPCGNLGNLTAGIFAKRMGMNAKFIAGTNRNNVFTEYLQTDVFSPRPSQKTISNAMDVGNPSNFARLMELYNSDVNALKKDIASRSVSDEQAKSAMHELWNEKKYILDPHGAVAYSALKKSGQGGIFLATAHPAKFKEAVEETLRIKIILPEKLNAVLQKEKSAVELPADFDLLKEFLLEQEHSPLLS